MLTSIMPILFWFLLFILLFQPFFLKKWIEKRNLKSAKKILTVSEAVSWLAILIIILLIVHGVNLMHKNLT